MKYDHILLAAPYIGGAELFALEKLRSGRWHGRLVVNPTLAALIAGEPTYAGVPVAVLDALEPLAQRISLAAIRAAAQAIDRAYGESPVLLGNMRAAASQLTARHAARRRCFVHDNSTYLNLKARTLIMLICLRSPMTYFACAHAMNAVMWPARALAALSVDYFGSYVPLEPGPPQVPGALRIMTIGRIEPAKGQQYAVRLAAQLRAVFPDVTLSLVGAVHDAAYFAQVQDGARRGGVAISQFVLDHADVGENIRGHDLVLHTSSVESLPLVLFEANASGVPFFALPAGGIPELLPARFLLSGQEAADAARIGAYFTRPALGLL